jgi:hypothetical protein
MSAKGSSHLDRFVTASALDASGDEESGLPTFNESEYVAHARASNKGLYAIHFLKPGGKGRTFEYVDMRSRCGDDDDFDNSRFRIAFFGMRPVIVTVEGRNLLRLYDHIHQHRTAWVMEVASGRDFIADGIAVVTRISVTEYRESLVPSQA